MSHNLESDMDSNKITKISKYADRRASAIEKVAVASIGSVGIAVSAFFASRTLSPPPPPPPPSLPLPSDLLVEAVDHATGKPISDGRVTLDTREGLREDRTDMNGRSFFRDVGKSRKRLSIEAFGYMPHDSYLPIAMENSFLRIELESLKTPVLSSSLVQSLSPSRPPSPHHPQRQFVERCSFAAEDLGIASLPEKSEGFRVTCKGMKPGALVEISSSGSVRAVNQGLNPNNNSAWVIAHITGAEGQGVRQSVNPLPNDGDFSLTGTAKVPLSGEVSTSIVVEHVQTWPNEHGPLHLGPNYHIVIRSP